jgi:hypothetical protein
MHDPKDFENYIVDSIENFKKIWKKEWLECNNVSYYNIDIFVKKFKNIVKDNIDIYNKLKIEFDTYINKWNTQETDIYKERKKNGLKTYIYFHDLIHHFLHLLRVARLYEKYGLMPYYLNLDYTDNRKICCICSMKRFSKTACVEYDKCENPRKDTWCWREHNKIDWNKIPKENYFYDPHRSKPFSKIFKENKYKVDTLNECRYL